MRIVKQLTVRTEMFFLSGHSQLMGSENVLHIQTFLYGDHLVRIFNFRVCVCVCVF